MATLVLTAVGTAVGGPIGGAIGAIIGQQIDQAIFKPAARQGPRLSDLSIQTSTYGAQIPKLFGRTRVAGTVIWATDLIETKGTQSNGKGRSSTDSYSYSASFAVLLSARRIVRVDRIWADGKLLRGSAGDLKVETVLRIHHGDDDQLADPLIASAEGASAPAYRGAAYAVFDAMQLADYGNRIPSMAFEVVADESEVGVGTILAALAAPDVDAAPGPTVAGFSASGDSVRAVAEAIDPVFPSICRDEGGTALRFVPNPVAAPNAHDLGARHDGGRGTERVAAISFDIEPLDRLPVAVTLGYRDPARDYQQGLQRARREGPGHQEARIDLPATIDATQAHALAQAVLARLGDARVTAKLTLPWRAMTLRPGDSFTLDASTWRIAELRFESMCVKLALVRAGESALAVATADAGRSVAQLDAVHGVTSLAAIDLPPLTDTAATRAALAVFAAGASPGWRRASLLASVDDGVTFVPMGRTALPATMGTTTSVLPVGTTPIADAVNAVEVALLSPSMTLVDADGAALLGGANLAMIGGELMQYGRAEPLSPGRWRLSGLWRGRRATEDAVTTHPIGSRFVLVDASTAAFLPDVLMQPGVRVLASGTGDVDPLPEATFASATRALMPLSVAHLQAVRLDGGDTLIRWIRRSREGWAWRDGVDAPLGEPSERYRVTWPGGEVEPVSSQFVYTAAARAADVATGATTVSFSIVQVGGAALSPSAIITLALS